MGMLKEDFLERIHKLADKRFKEAALELRLQFEDSLPEIVLSFHKSMGAMQEKFSRLEKNGENDSLSWVYISYLRSGILTHGTCFQIDGYDCRNRISSVECSLLWEYSYIWVAYYSVCNEVAKEFERQTAVKKYELDFLLFELAERFYNIAQEQFPAIVKKWLKEYGDQSINGQKVTFMVGEFLSQAKFILLWNNDHIEWKQEEKEDKEMWDEID